MSNRYSYTGENSIIIQDGNIIWNNESHDQSLQYMDANDVTIPDSSINDSYVTAIDSNETQYLSILESPSDITLEDLNNLTLNSSEAQEHIILSEDIAASLSENHSEDNNSDTNNQVVVFTLEGSDDLYGIQIAQDDQGNTQKYQFKFRATSDGQLEADPESIQLLSSDDQTETELEVEQPNTEGIDEIQESEDHEYFLIPAELASENTDNVDDVPTDDNNLVYVKGEIHSPVPFEENESEAVFQGTEEEVQTENYENTIVETEVYYNNESGHDAVCNVASHSYIKQENVSEDLDNTVENQFNEDVFDETIQPENVIFSETEEQETINNSQQVPNKDYSDNKIKLERYENQESHTRQNRSEIINQFITNSEQIEVQFENEMDSYERMSENCEYTEVYENQESDEYTETEVVNNDAESDGEQYEIVKEMHLSGEAPTEFEEQFPVDTNSEQILHEIIEREQGPTVERTNILKHALNSDKQAKSRKPLVSVKYYVVYPEKENVISMEGNTNISTNYSIPKLSKPNPRSVLRTSFSKPKEMEEIKHSITTFPQCDLFQKRFARSKEAVQAKLFHNFINRTTILQAPIRQKRQPRKQEIKPVSERRDEEIIVQEVMMTSNGIIENLNKKVKNKKFQVTAIVELSDSEEDISNLKTGQTWNKTGQRSREFSNSEISIIEIGSEDETSNLNSTENSEVFNIKRGKGRPKKIEQNQPEAFKRRRGRPPKHKSSSINGLVNLDLSPSKRNCIESVNIISEEVSTESDQNSVIQPEIQSEQTLKCKGNAFEVDKKEIACPYCTKTFPSQNSLNTHKIHHNLENSLKTKAMFSKPTLTSRQSILPKIEYSHKCDNCQQTFKNSILLQRHNCVKKQQTRNCPVCLKEFQDIVLFNMHKKSHVKRNLVSNTSIAKVSPKKVFSRSSCNISRPSYNTARSSSVTKPTIDSNFKCLICSKVCNSQVNLNTHVKTHKTFVCSNCSATFSSRLLLDTHVRTSCVKVKSPLNKRLSFKIRKSFIHTPPRRLSILKPNETSLNTTLDQSVSSIKLVCDVCKVKFSTYRNLYTHKVQKHGLNTPDKSLMAKPKQGNYKPKAAHGGIPANDRMRKAYEALRKKLAETQEVSNLGQ